MDCRERLQRFSLKSSHLTLLSHFLKIMLPTICVCRENKRIISHLRWFQLLLSELLAIDDVVADGAVWLCIMQGCTWLETRSSIHGGKSHLRPLAALDHWYGNWPVVQWSYPRLILWHGWTPIQERFEVTAAKYNGTFPLSDCPTHAIIIPTCLFWSHSRAHFWHCAWSACCALLSVEINFRGAVHW